MKKHYLSSLLIALTLLSKAQYSWLVKNDFPSTARLAQAAFSVNGTGYIVGGFTEVPNTIINEVWAYNPAADSWTQKSNFGYNSSGAGVFVIGNNAYVCGGGTGGGNNSNALSLYNPTNDSWSSRATFPETGVSGAFNFAINGLGYVGAGERNGANNSTTVYSYDPESDSWTAVANYPVSVVNPIGFAIDSFGYAGLGSDGSNHLSNAFYKYSPATNSWTAIAPFPGELRSSSMAFVMNGKGYVGGGWTTIPNAINSVYNVGDFFEYDPASDTWEPVSGIPGRGRDLSAAFVINNAAYLAGGFDFYISNAINSVAEFGTCGKIAGIMPVEGNSNTGIQIYPNPSSSDVTVKINSQSNSEIKYEIVAIDGKVIKTGTTRQNSFGFNSSTLADGIYIINVNDNQGVHGAQRCEVIH